MKNKQACVALSNQFVIYNVEVTVYIKKQNRTYTSQKEWHKWGVKEKHLIAIDCDVVSICEAHIMLNQTVINEKVAIDVIMHSGEVVETISPRNFTTIFYRICIVAVSGDFNERIGNQPGFIYCLPTRRLDLQKNMFVE